MYDSRGQQHRNKSIMSFRSKTPEGKPIQSSNIGNDFTDGHRGMARAVASAKKFVNTRRRFHIKQDIRNQDWKTEY